MESIRLSNVHPHDVETLAAIYSAEMMSRIRFGLWAALPAILLAVAACAPRIDKSKPSPGVWSQEKLAAATTSDGYIGNDACQPCHPGEFQKHHGSRHMKTLYEGFTDVLGPLAPPEGQVPNGGKVTYDQGQLVIEAPNKDTGQPVPIPIDLVLGSGKTGMTFLAVHPGGSVEIRQSWFPSEKCFRVTPGQEDFSNKTIGQTHGVDDAMHCIGCHSVPRPDTSLIPEPRFFGVGCESCHGAGAAHAKAMAAGDKTRGLLLNKFTDKGGKVINDTCGKCHRTPAAVAKLDKLSQQATNRFQPYGLAKSKCFIKSDDKLSCVTCHNPHEDASKDEAGYVKACIQCHSAPEKVCKVNPVNDCIRCHMPTKPVFPGTPFPVKMADHFIRINKDISK